MIGGRYLWSKLTPHFGNAFFNCCTASIDAILVSNRPSLVSCFILTNSRRAGSDIRLHPLRLRLLNFGSLTNALTILMHVQKTPASVLEQAWRHAFEWVPCSQYLWPFIWAEIRVYRGKRGGRVSA